MAIEYGYADYSSTFPDDPLTIPDGRGGTKQWPKNYDGTYTHQPTTVYTAIKKSLNTIAVRVGQIVDVDNMYDFCVDTLNISTLVESDRDLAPLVLGSMTNERI